jgi:hypothetical protein
MRPTLFAFTALAFTLTLQSGGAHAARPMNTDDARIVDAKSCQLESWVKRPQGRTEFWAQPGCNFSGNLELTVGTALTHESGSTRSSSQMLQAKTLFKPLETNGWGIGLAVGLQRDPRPGAGGASDVYTYVPMSFSLRDDRLVLHTNLGALREQDTRRNRFTWGLGTEAQLSERSWLIAETYGQSAEKPLFQVGLRHWLVPDRVQIDATYGNRLDGGGQRWFSIGLRLLTPAFLP